MPGADAHPLMKSDADRLRDARWGAKLNGWLAAVRSSPPRYCLCAGFAVGDMLRCEGGCDGWFHLACLGLTAAPAGVWRCDACATGPAKRGRQSSLQCCVNISITFTAKAGSAQRPSSSPSHSGVAILSKVEF